MASSAKKPASTAGKKKGNDEKGKLDLAAEEKLLIDKYKDRCDIVKGSIKDAGTSKQFGNKRSVDIRCMGEGCKTVRRVATSDLHQVSMCPDCIRQVRLDRRKDARAAKRKNGPAKKIGGPNKAKTAAAPKAPHGDSSKKGPSKVGETKKPAPHKAPKPMREKVQTPVPDSDDRGSDDFLQRQLDSVDN